MRIEYGLTSRFLTSHAGLVCLYGLLQSARLQSLFGPTLKTIPDAVIFTVQTVLLALGKTDFEAVTAFRDDVAFGHLLRLKRVPSAEILRQRLDGAPAKTDAALPAAAGSARGAACECSGLCAPGHRHHPHGQLGHPSRGGLLHL